MSKSFDAWYEESHSSPRSPGSQFSILLLTLIVLFGLMYLAETDTPIAGAQSKSYEVVSVKKGAVQVIDKTTGEYTQLPDPELVAKALQGDLKRGDIIRY